MVQGFLKGGPPSQVDKGNTVEKISSAPTDGIHEEKRNDRYKGWIPHSLTTREDAEDLNKVLMYYNDLMARPEATASRTVAYTLMDDRLLARRTREISLLSTYMETISPVGWIDGLQGSFSMVTFGINTKDRNYDASTDPSVLDAVRSAKALAPDTGRRAEVIRHIAEGLREGKKELTFGSLVKSELYTARLIDDFSALSDDESAKVRGFLMFFNMHSEDVERLLTKKDPTKEQPENRLTVAYRGSKVVGIEVTEQRTIMIDGRVPLRTVELTDSLSEKGESVNQYYGTALFAMLNAVMVHDPHILFTETSPTSTMQLRVAHEMGRRFSTDTAETYGNKRGSGIMADHYRGRGRYHSAVVTSWSQSDMSGIKMQLRKDEE